jgi:hypothetical protein
MRRRSLPDFPSKCLGFIFCEIFSNLVATGCRRGRTPERPLRQPPKVWLMKPDLSSCEGRTAASGAMCAEIGLTHVSDRARECARSPKSRATMRPFKIERPKVTNGYRRVLRS